MFTNKAKRRRRRIVRGLALVVSLGALALLVTSSELDVLGMRRTPYIATAFQAKMMCSCLFVIGRDNSHFDESYCGDYSAQAPLWILTNHVDREARAVTSSLLDTGVLFAHTARYVDDRLGCQLSAS